MHGSDVANRRDGRHQLDRPGLIVDGVDRRWLGAIVVACAVLVAVVAPNVSSRRVSGSPIPGRVDGPPAPGSCVTAMVDPWRSNPEPASAVGGVIDFPTAHFGPCDGAVVGEVAFVDTTALPPERIDANDYQNVVAQCALDAIGYLGSIPPVVGRGVGQSGILWTSVLDFRYTQIGPTDVQRAAGQQWSACAVGSADPTPYVGRLRDVLTTGVLPPVFGSCWPSIDVSGPKEIRCDSPHTVELLGATSLGSTPVSAAEVREACTVYAGRALRTADPTRDGAIRPEILAFDQDAAIIPPIDSSLANRYVDCVLNAQNGRHLNNTLVGISQRPLPLA
jgi:hypothetical protein